MHRFGRSAQKKMNDRWGGAFILAVVLAVVGAWQLGGWLGNNLGDKQAAIEPVPGMESTDSIDQGTALGTGTLAQPHEYQVHFVQVGAFRSEGAARNLVKALSEAGYLVGTAPKNAQGLAKVYVGPYMTASAAAEAKAQLAQDAATKNSFSVAMTVDYKPDAVMAMTGSANSSLQKGLDSLNSYLYEVGNWFAARAENQPADGALIASLSQELSKYVESMDRADANPAVAKFLDIVDTAAESAAAIEAAATAAPGSEEFQAAMSGFVTLLDQYHAFHVQNGGN